MEQSAAPSRREHVCQRCEWRWFSRLERPVMCPRCRRFAWDRAAASRQAPGAESEEP